MDKLLRYVQSLLQKCVSNVYLRQHVTSIITDYIWNRCCNVALRMLLDDIVTSGKRSTTSSQQDLNYTVDLLEHCADYLKTYSDEILTELLYYRSATEQAVRHRHSWCLSLQACRDNGSLRTVDSRWLLQSITCYAHRCCISERLSHTSAENVFVCVGAAVNGSRPCQEKQNIIVVQCKHFLIYWLCIVGVFHDDPSSANSLYFRISSRCFLAYACLERKIV